MDSSKLLVTCLVAALYFMHGASGVSTWGYFGNDDPSHWTTSDNQCGGNSQSPINIIPSTTKHDPNIQKFTYNNFDNTNGLTLELSNNGHTAKLSFSGTARTMTGGGLTGEYTVAQLHFHWGKSDSTGSEHTVKGKQFPMEMHIVTYKSAYGNISESLGHSDGLAVLGFFFEVGNTAHTGMDNIVNSLTQVTAKDATHSVTAFKLNDILPSSFPDFYRYSGSLTTPPCSQVVTWTVFAETIKITAAQLAKFRTLQMEEDNDESNKNMYNNFRPVQALNSRVVKANFMADSGLRPSIHLSIMLLPILSFVLKRLV